MTDQRSPKEIENDIERERASLGDTLEDLQERFSIDGVVRQVSDQIREHGGDIGNSISRSVRDNPMAVALTGVGLAWMIFGNRNDSDRSRPDDRYLGSQRRYSSDMGKRRGLNDGYGDRAELPGGHHDSRPGTTRGIQTSGDMPDWARQDDSTSAGGHHWHEEGDDDSGRSFGDRTRGAADNVKDTGSRVGGAMAATASKAADTASGVGASAADTLRTTGASVASGAGAARDKASDMAGNLTARAAATRDRLAQGTETLSEEARERVVAARKRALRARDAAAGYARQGRDRAVDIFEEQPLIAGALALAMGAAIGAALPRTRTEDAYLGDESDSLFAEAERIFAEERAKTEKVATAAIDEAKDVLTEAQTAAEDTAAKAKADADRHSSADTAAQALADKAKDAGQRVADSATEEADKQRLGKPRT